MTQHDAMHDEPDYTKTPKKAYTKPELTTYGTLNDLTHGSGTLVGDGQIGISGDSLVNS